MEIDLNLSKEQYYEFVSYINSGKPICIPVTPTIQVKLEVTTITSKWTGTNPAWIEVTMGLVQDFTQEKENGVDNK